MLNNPVAHFSKRYIAALRLHATGRSRIIPPTAQGLGRAAVGLETWDLARLHEAALKDLMVSPGLAARRKSVEKQVGAYFLETLAPIEETHRIARVAKRRIRELDAALEARNDTLESARKTLALEVSRRQAAEAELAKGLRDCDVLLEQSRLMRVQMRGLARRLLTAQEDERGEISRELHEEIAQTLVGINVLLFSLSKAATINTVGLKRKIAATQRLLVRSVSTVHRFAGELRPSLLDDLGLIPALRSYLRALPLRHGLQIHFKAFAEVEGMEDRKRTACYRVAQEALLNVVRHAGASVAMVELKKVGNGVRMEVSDNGKAFDPARVFASETIKRLGLLGMRERVEMVGGQFSIVSAAGKGTIVRAEFPFSSNRRIKPP